VVARAAKASIIVRFASVAATALVDAGYYVGAGRIYRTRPIQAAIESAFKASQRTGRSGDRLGSDVDASARRATEAPAAGGTTRGSSLVFQGLLSGLINMTCLHYILRGCGHVRSVLGSGTSGTPSHVPYFPPYFPPYLRATHRVMGSDHLDLAV